MFVPSSLKRTCKSTSPSDSFPLFRFSMQSLVYVFEGQQMRVDFFHNESFPLKGFAYSILRIDFSSICTQCNEFRKVFCNFYRRTWTHDFPQVIFTKPVQIITIQQDEAEICIHIPFMPHRHALGFQIVVYKNRMWMYLHLNFFSWLFLNN